jgi:hypothetical protein
VNDGDVITRNASWTRVGSFTIENQNSVTVENGRLKINSRNVANIGTYVKAVRIVGPNNSIQSATIDQNGLVHFADTLWITPGHHDYFVEVQFTKALPTRTNITTSLAQGKISIGMMRFTAAMLPTFYLQTVTIK